MFHVSSGKNLPTPALQSALKQKQCYIELVRGTEDTVSSNYREDNMIRSTPSLVKSLSAVVPAGPKTNWEAKVSLCSEWTQKSRWICIALDDIPNKLTNVQNWNTWKNRPLHWKGCRFSRASEALGIAPATLPWLCGLRQQTGTGHFFKEGGKKSSQKQCSSCKAEAQESWWYNQK